MISHERLLHLFVYEADTGNFVRRVATGRHGCYRVGTVAGYVNDKGYVIINVDGRDYRAHRLAFFYMKGRWPDPEVDHQDLNGSNNRWDNLREATRSQNLANRRVRSSTGYKGVYWDKRRGKFAAQVSNLKLGRFDTAEEAHAACIAEAQKQFGEFARLV